MNQLSVVRQGVRTALLNHATIPSLVGSRVYAKTSSIEEDFPYIRMVHLYGGDENTNPSRSFDIVLRVDAVSTNEAEAETIANYIDEALAGVTLTLPDGYTNWTPVRQMFPFDDTILVASNEYYSHGAQYRIRGVK